MRITTLATALLLAAALGAPGKARAVDTATSAPAVASAPASPVSGAGAGSVDKPQATPTRSATQGAKLYAPTSQLINWPMQVMVSTDIPESAEPRLTLLVGHGHSEHEGENCANIPASVVSRNQSWVGGGETDGANAQHVGTVLLFDLASSQCKLDPIKAMTRVRPILEWTPVDKPCTDCRLIGTVLVNLGSATTAFIEAALAVAAGVLLIVILVRLGRTHRLAEFFFSADDGTLSLSMLQMALWTLAAAMMVIFEDLLRLDTPDVPSSIVVLMGMSILTTGASYHLTTNPPNGTTPPAKTTLPASPLSDLLAVADAAGVTRLSLSRAQMLLWTLVMIVLFIAKSAVNQALWDIPWPLVALMGVSQVGYLGGKFSQS